MILSLEGGGYKGSFQWGVIQGLNLDPNEVEAVFGTSVGSLNALGVNNLTEIDNIWKQVINDGLKFHKKPWYSVFGLALKTRRGYYDNNLNEILENTLSKQFIGINIPMYVTVVDVKYGDIYYIEIKKLVRTFECHWFNRDMEHVFADNYDVIDTAKIITASTTIPGMFAPITGIRGPKPNMELVDGGVRDINPLSGAVKLGARSVIAIKCGPWDIKEAKKLDRVDRILSRTLDIFTNEISYNDIKQFVMYNEIAKTSSILAEKNAIRYIPIYAIVPEFHLMENSLEPTKKELITAYGHGFALGTQFRQFPESFRMG